MRAAFCVTFIIAFGHLPVAGAAAQATRELRGTVIDSMRAAGPVRDGVVRMDRSGTIARTDANGRFRFPSVGAADTRVFYSVAWLDSLGIEAIEARIVPTAAKGVGDVVLAIPSYATLQRGACGTPLADTLGLVMGVIQTSTGDERDTGVVRASWWTESTVGGRPTVELVELRNTVEEDGSFILCGVAIGAAVRMEALVRGTSVSRRLILERRAQRVDLRIADRNERVRLRGRVIGAQGEPLGAVLVISAIDTVVRTTSSGDGRFVLDGVPASTGELILRRLGFAERVADVDPTSGTLDLGDLPMSRLPASLREVRVLATSSRWRAEFEERRRGALGRFLDDSALARLPVRTVTAIAALAPRLAVTRSVGGEALKLRAGHGFCAPRFFVDGADVGRLDAPDQRGEQAAYLSRAARVEVYTAAETPARFNDNDGCGAVVIWTQ